MAAYVGVVLLDQVGIYCPVLTDNLHLHWTSYTRLGRSSTHIKVLT